MIPHEISDQPWAKAGIDLFSYKGHEYILAVNYYSKYPDNAILPDETSRATTVATKSIFGRFGFPTTVVSDNGPQFTSNEFSAFARDWGFSHITSSPGYPQSNGQAKRAVQTVKEILLKCEEAGLHPSLGLLSYRITPLEEIGQSPAQLLMSRRL